MDEFIESLVEAKKDWSWNASNRIRSAPTPRSLADIKRAYLAHIQGEDETRWKSGWREIYGIIDEEGAFHFKSVRVLPGEKLRPLQSHAHFFPTLNEHRKVGFTYEPGFQLIAIDEQVDRQTVDVIAEELRSKGYKPRFAWSGWFTGWGGRWIEL